ncbi:MAG: NADH-quinone oxidoreductase subunit M [Verrucomicrobiota bacterium]
MLAWTVYSSFIGVAVLLFLPRDNAGLARAVALATALVGLVLSVAGALTLGSAVSVVCKVPWIESLGVSYHLAVDGISLTLLLLTGIAAVAGILFSWNIAHRAKEFFAFYLALIGGVYGVFLSFDLFLLFVFYELAIIPKYFLIAIWGSTNRSYGAMKLALYSFVGSAMVLIGIIAAFVVAGGHTMDLAELARFPFPERFQYWAFPLVFIGFAVLAGLWPFHTWAPTGHVAAPTAASMLLAGVVMKLGAYGSLRVAMTLFPLGLKAWHTEVALLAVIGIVYGALVALVQKDFKFVIGYSSVSHMGFVILGLCTLNAIGLSGAVLQMFSHGIIAGLLFGVVGRMVYDRTHTRDLNALEGMQLAKVLPFAAVTFVLASVASMGLPGFSGFVAELQVLIGAWHAFPKLAIVAGVGILIGVAYTLRALQKAFFGDQSAHLSDATQDHRHLARITLPERAGGLVLLATSLAIGLYPRILLDLIVPSFGGPLFEGMRKAGIL